jgi:hypothetical protein
LGGALLDHLGSIAGLLGHRDDELVVAAAVRRLLGGHVSDARTVRHRRSGRDLHDRFGRVWDERERAATSSFGVDRSYRLWLG